MLVRFFSRQQYKNIVAQTNKSLRQQEIEKNL